LFEILFEGLGSAYDIAGAASPFTCVPQSWAEPGVRWIALLAPETLQAGASKHRGPRSVGNGGPTL